MLKPSDQGDLHVYDPGPSPIRALYDEHRQPAWTDAVFWMLVGALCLYLAQLTLRA